ncbi:MAG: cytochrome c family protein [candidate division Zixibacteria bacterium]|nr:cytochrome c family protein [candidate division Zixibacteria bacterium]
MKKASWVLIICLALYLVFSLAYANSDPKGEATKDTTKAEKVLKAKYLGATVCKPCHNAELKGKVYDKWASSKHATAYKTLANEESIKIAKGMKIENPQKSEKCLKCHVTGYNATAELKDVKFDIAEGVTCEGCHGAGSGYKLVHMKDPVKAKEMGLLKPGEKECKACHNQESPTYKEFKFAEAWKAVDHTYRKKK